MTDFEKDVRGFSDEKIVTLIKQYDNLCKPMSQRLHNDDTEIVKLMVDYDLTQSLLSKAAIITSLMREAISRGIQIDY